MLPQQPSNVYTYSGVSKLGSDAVEPLPKLLQDPNPKVRSCAERMEGKSMNVSRLLSSIPKLVVLCTTLLFLWSMTTLPAWAKVGTITEFPLPAPSSAPFGITLGPDGKVWFTESQGNNIGRIAAK
jgi:hypothetical protein